MNENLFVFYSWVMSKLAKLTHMAVITILFNNIHLFYILYILGLLLSCKSDFLPIANVIYINKNI